MKVAVIGSSGYIASFLLEKLAMEDSIEKVWKIDQVGNADDYLDLACPEKFAYELLEGIDYVIFMAAVSGPDQCAVNLEQCWSINVTGTAYFIEKAIEKKCRVLFFSSDAVFGDKPGQIYLEDSETKAETPYGKMKKAVEDKFKESPSFKTIRLSYVVSVRDKFVSYCFKCIKEGKTAEVFHPFYRNCISVSDVVQAVFWLLQHWEGYHGFALNAAGTELVSRVRIADEINRYLGEQLQYSIVKPDAAFYKNRPAITQMQSRYLKEYHILEEKSFTEKFRIELEKGKGDKGKE